jgi:uncharacterized protein YhaN
MYLKELTLRDFGANVYQDARLGNIGDGLTVIGGPQRAGKTTFLHAIRRLGYGVEKGADLAPPADEYDVRATINHEGHDYMLKLSGHGTPTVVSVGEGPSVSIEEVFGGVSRRQYEQLFTITLDELKRLPETVGSTEDISEILLGAAYGDVAVIPELQSRFDERAYEIGRSFGKPTKQSQLQPAMDTIEAGIEDRDEANEQVEEWAERRQELDSLEEQIAELESRLEDHEHQSERLEVIDDEYEDFSKYRDITRSLDESEIEEARDMPDDAERQIEDLISAYKDAIKRRETVRDSLADNALANNIDQYQAALLEHESTIEDLDRQVSRLESEASMLRESEDELRETREELKHSVRELYAGWSGNFDPVLEIQADAVTDKQVASTVEKFSKAKDRLEEAQQEYQQLENRLREYEQEQSESGPGASSGNARLVQAISVGLVSLGVGIGGSLLGFFLEAGAASALILISGLYVVLTRDDQSSTEIDTARELQASIQTTRADLKAVEGDIEDAREELEDAESELKQVKTEVGLPTDLPLDGVGDFYTDVTECQAAIRELLDNEHEHAEKLRDLVSELEAAEDTISNVRETRWDEKRPLETLDVLLSAIGTAYADLEDAVELANVQENRESIEADIVEFTSGWSGVEVIDVEAKSPGAILQELEDVQQAVEAANTVLEDVEKRDSFITRIQNKLRSGATAAAFDHANQDDESWFKCFERIALQYKDAKDVHETKGTVNDDLDETNELLEEAKEDRTKLEEKLTELKSDDDIVAARQQISDGREELRELGEEYAVNRIAEQLTERLHERFIEEVAGPLIDDASDIFQRITQEYDGIDHNDSFDNLDFEALRDGSVLHESDELSRATSEQLFLALRFARIRQLDVSLPIVIDDAMTNFDPAHGARTFKTIAELAETNQVFFLTCHPEAVMLADSYGGPSQFWCLENGRFNGPATSSDSVYDLLSAERPAKSTF